MRNIFITAIFIVIYSSITLQAGSAETRTAILGVFPWEPYVSEKKDDHGMFTEIVVSALKAVGYDTTIKGYQFGRIMHYLESGDIDLSPAISPTDERKKFIDFTSSIYDVDMVFIYKKRSFQGSSIDDLKGRTGGVMTGTFWEDVLNRSGIKYETVTSQEQNVQKLITGRVDFVCMPKTIAQRIIIQLGDDPNSYEYLLYKREGQPVGISKKTKLRDLKTDFEKGLTIIKHNGTYDKIVSRYK